MSGTVFEYGIDCFPSDVARGLAEFHHGAVKCLRRDTAEHQQVRKATDRIGAAAEAKKIDSVAGLIMVDDEFVAVGNVALDAGARHRSEELLDEANRSGEGGSSDVGTEAGVIEYNLLRRIDAGVRVVTRAAVHLIDVANALFRTGTAVLAGPVREHNDVLRHNTLRVSYVDDSEMGTGSYADAFLARKV